MLDWTLVTVGILLLILGFVGCVVPCLPGPLLGWCALLSIAFSRFAIPTVWLVVAGVVMAIATVLDYVVPALGARKFNCGKLGVFGCVAGTIIGLFFMPIGLLVGPFLGAMIGELLAGKEVRQSLKGAVGAFLGYAAGILLKLICCGSLAAVFVQAVLAAT